MIKVEEIRRNIMLFGMFKNNKNKIKECYMTNRDKFHSNFSLNEKIKTFSIEFYDREYTQYYEKDIKIDLFEKRTRDLLYTNAVIEDFSKKINKYKESFSDEKDKLLITEELSRIERLDYFVSNIEKIIEDIDTRIANRNSVIKKIEDINGLISKFNLFHQNAKFITKVIREDITENESSETVLNEIKELHNYINLIDFFENFTDKRGFCHNVEELNEKKAWVDIIRNLSFETYNDEIYEKFVEDKESLLKLLSISKNIESYFDDIKIELERLKIKTSVNAILEKVLKFEYRELEEEYFHKRELYTSQAIDANDLIQKLIELNTKVKKIISNYNSLLSPFENSIKMLDIEKDTEIEDIKDYFLYSISKSIERKLSIYGESKNITADSVEKMINLVEEKLYTLTEDQKNAIYRSVEILNRETTGSCLIQGDVSSGKTIVTIVLMFLVAKNKMKSVYIVPRKVLRLQHLRTLQKYNELFGFNFKIYDASENFEIKDADIVVNGYSFSDKKFSEVEFSLGIIDEIQLFGVEQRNKVQKKYSNIDMFYTTATPHPRTKLISLIGNMDIIEIKQLPPGRKLKNTQTFTEIDSQHIELINKEAKNGNAILIVCPLVNKRGDGDFESIKIAHLKYQELFPDLTVEKLMSNMADEKKEDLIDKTVNGEIDILVATKSIEVGVDIPRASVIVIHYPHSMKIKWGVSQLHQLRGRVGRNNNDSYCLIEAPLTIEEGSPIDSVLKTQDVFELTKNDFNWRGFESIIGTKQSGSKGSRNDQEKRIKAYQIIAENIPRIVNDYDKHFISRLEEHLAENKIENLN